MQRIIGNDFQPSDNLFTTEHYPDFEPFVSAWTEQQSVTRHVLAEMGNPDRVMEGIARTVTPPVRIRATVGGLAGQLLFHEIHHRAQVMAMLRQVGVKAENLDYSILIFERTTIT